MTHCSEHDWTLTTVYQFGFHGAESQFLKDRLEAPMTTLWKHHGQGFGRTRFVVA